MVTIRIETGNEAFADDNRGPEIARILRKIADEYSDGGRAQYGGLYDINGNKVGGVKDEG